MFLNCESALTSNDMSNKQMKYRFTNFNKHTKKKREFYDEENEECLI